ncbi:ECF RNA polymerase sigma factor SigW [Planctomycetales bacterium 10988]|nr:ECF RNA polymerase sigma factor SigW [Planctomycetales bacterium 10988]
MDKEEMIRLVELARQGDSQAFGQLAQNFESTIFSIALRRLGNYAEAQELAQEVFIQAFNKLHQLKEPICFAGWLRSMAARMAINCIKRRKSTVSSEPEMLEASYVDRETPLDAALASERSSQVRAGLARLRKMDRETLVAFYMHGESIEQMSHHFDSPVGTIKRRLHTARKRLAEELAEMAAV